MKLLLRNRVVISLCTFLLASSSFAADTLNSTVTTPNGEFEIQILDATSSISYPLEIRAKVVNKTNLQLSARLACNFRLKSGARKDDPSCVQIDKLNPGASQHFRYRSLSSEFGIDDVATVHWNPQQLSTDVEYIFKQSVVTKAIGAAKVTATVGVHSFAIEIENNSRSAIEVLWDDSSFVGESRKAGRIFHDGIKYDEREKSQPNTVIPPSARMEDHATPSANVYFGYSREWSTRPFVPMSILMDQVDKLAPVGDKIGLFLQLLIGGKKVPVSFTFETQSVKSGNQILLPAF